MIRCHDGSTYLIQTVEQDSTPAVAVCCATCNAVLAVGPRSEVCAQL